MAYLAELIASVLAKIGLQWWENRRKQGALNAKNDANSLSDDAAIDELRSKWSRD